MALNDIYLFTTSYTSSDTGSLRANYPIKQKYRQILNTSTPLFPEAYELVSSDKYWFPFIDIQQIDDNYIEYETGDEFTFDLDSFVRSKLFSAPSTQKTKHQDFPTNTKKLYANEIYEATDFFFNWSDTGFDENDNPYPSSQVRKWRVFDAPQDSWTAFWYEPFAERFYPLPDTDVLNSISDRNDFVGDRWNLFTGDSDGMDLTTFSLRKVDELVAVGLSRDSAKATVQNEEDRVLSRIYGPNQVSGVSVFNTQTTPTLRRVDDGYSNAGATVTILRSSGGSQGEGGGGSSDKPAITQQFYDKNGNIFVDRFEFDYRPNSVNYANIGAEWTEIPRVNNSPLLDFRNFKLMKISFEFLVGDNNNIFTSCDDKIRLLRQMAIRPRPVTFIGFDEMFNDQLLYSASFERQPQGIKFAIIDMSITSVQRARAGQGSEPGTGIQQPTGEINRATISMTIQELPFEEQTLERLPLLPEDQIPKGEGKKDEDAPCRNKYSQSPVAVKIKYNYSYNQFAKFNCGKLVTSPTSFNIVFGLG